METTENIGQSGVESEVSIGNGPDGATGALADGASKTTASGGGRLGKVTPARQAQRGRPPNLSQSKVSDVAEQEAATARSVEQFPNAVLLDVDPLPMIREIDPKGPASELSWHVFAELVQKIEASEPDRRLVRVWHPEPKAEVLNGAYAGAEVLTGDQAYQWSDGEICQVPG